MMHSADGSVRAGGARGDCLLPIASLLIGLAHGWAAEPMSQKATAAKGTPMAPTARRRLKTPGGSPE